jgi:hypothetical protein
MDDGGEPASRGGCAASENLSRRATRTEDNSNVLPLQQPGDIDDTLTDLAIRSSTASGEELEW